MSVNFKSWPMPPLASALWRGVRCKCPVCGIGRTFQGFLRVTRNCVHCGAPLGRIRADDAPPYFTIFIVGHLVMPWVFWLDRKYEPAIWLQMAVWLPVFAVLTTLLLRPVKGATVGLMWRLGFAKDSAET
jgi:uncharacterized protein (DUF983 family)